MMENRGLSGWNRINSEIENEKTAQRNNERSGPTVRPSETSLIDRAKAPKVGSENSPDFSPVATAPDRPDSETVLALPSFFPNMSLEEAASVMRNDLSFNSQGWGALRSPILDVITGKACFSLGSALVSGIVANCGIEPSQTVGSIEDVYWKAVGDDLSKWKEAAREVYKETVEFPPKAVDLVEDASTKLAHNFKGMDLVLSAFGADLGIPVYNAGKGWFKGTPTVDFSTTLSGCNLRFNFKGDTKLKAPETGESCSDQVSETVNFNLKKPHMLRYFGMSFNTDDSWSMLFGATVAIPFYNPSISADAAARIISDYGTAVGKELGNINQSFVGKINRILYDR